MAFLIGSIIILIILMIFVYVYWDQKPKFIRENAMNYVYGLVQPKTNSADGNVTYYGDYDTQDMCENTCGTMPGCKAYTWHDNTGDNPFAKQCFGLGVVGKKVSEPNHFSGYMTASANPFTTFSNTLQRRLGMDSAGDTNMKQNFTPGISSVGFGTQYQGYYNPSVLPI